MKISKYLKIMTVVFGLLVVASCDSSLDNPSENVQLLDDVDYTQTQDMVLILNGAYTLFYAIQWETFPTIAVRGDDVNAAGDQAPLTDTDLFQYDRSFWLYNSTWLNLYSDIISFYGAIEAIENYKVYAPNPAEADQYIAEINVMIGYEMLQLSRLWGEIIIPTSSNTIELYDLPLSTVEEVMEHISNLMDESIPLLPNVRPNQRTDIPGGVTAYTAMAVKAIANLEINNFQEVANTTGEIISANAFVLDNDFYELFKIPGKLNSENLLEFQYSDFNQNAGTEKNYLNAFFGPTSWTPAVANAGGGWGFYEPSLKYIKFMLDRGEQVRLETSVIFTPDGMARIMEDPAHATLPAWVSNTTRDGDTFNNSARLLFLSGKHYLPSNQLIPGRNSYGSNKNFICIRYAEILLMHAEALTQGATSSAMSADDAVNMVRNRAGLANISGATLETVLDEKFAELAMEWGIRFYDMARYNRVDALSYEGRTYTEADQYLPYPLAQQDLLPQLDVD